MTASKTQVRLRYPQAWIEWQTNPQRGRWFVWRDTRTEDLLGRGMSKREAWEDAAERLGK